MNTINTYGYAVFGNGNVPLHIVQINHNMLSAFSVFSTAKEAREYILKEKESLSRYAALAYNPDFNFSVELIKLFTNNRKGMFSKLENHQVYIA